MSLTSTRTIAFVLAASLGTFAMAATPAAAEGFNQLIQVQQVKAQSAGSNTAAPADELQMLKVQEQMANRNRSNQSSSNLLKKQSDTQNAIIQNIK